MGLKMKSLKKASNFLFVTFFLIWAPLINGTPENCSIGSIFAHGLADTATQAFKYLEKDIILKPFETFNFPDATDRFFRVKFRCTSLGQDNEIARLHKAYQQYTADKEEVILFGLSRGASTALNFVATHQPQQVSALVLESPFDSIESIIKYQLPGLRLSINEKNIAWGQSIMSFIFAKYNPQGIQPIQVIDKIDKNIPILIICSKQDTRVPYTSSVEIYKKLVQSGHKKVHILILDCGKHSKILWDKQEHVYRNCVHAFYKKYNLPYMSAYADLGDQIINGTQPALTNLF